MFKPVYRFTPFLISCLERIASQSVLIEQAGKKPGIKLTVAKDSFNRSVHSSTWIEGNMLSLAQVASLSAHQNVAAQSQQKLEVQNCIKALRWVLQHKNIPLTEPKILTLHTLMTRGLLPEERCGKYRNVQNYIVNARKQILFTPPPSAKVASEMGRLFLWFKNSSREHALVRSAIFHHQFVGVHPFTDGNGRVVRAASQWILFNGGYDPVWTLGLDEYFARDRAKYYDMIQQTHDMDGDYTHWIEYVAQGLVEAIETVGRRFKEEARKYKIPLTPKQSELLGLLEKRGILGSAQICQQMNINRARVNQLISPLVKAGIVIKQGTTRAVKYNLA